MEILRNAIRCNLCGNVIESEYRHDMRWCECGAVAVDGGHSYLKRSFVNSPKDYTEMSEVVYTDEELAEQARLQEDLREEAAR